MAVSNKGGEKIDEIANAVSFLPKTSLKTTTRPSVSATIETTLEGMSIADLANDATNNPPKRKKLAVNVRARGPRFGLAQWRRLVRSSNDLAQRRGAPYREHIPWDEVRKHNQPHDCWMVLRGVVYNIGPYLAYHPGGIEIFSKAKLLGEDGTKLFDKYHPWVSIEGLIETLTIGSVAKLEDDDHTPTTSGGKC
jgi:cytochrome b involved in lipid metabolism